MCRNIAIIDHGRVVENTSMRSLLSKLQQETFVLDLDKAISETPQLTSYAFKLVASQSLEVEIKRGQHLNDVFAMLSQQGIKVLSMRNKTNRLEELFVRLVEKNLNEGASA